MSNGYGSNLIKACSLPFPKAHSCIYQVDFDRVAFVEVAAEDLKCQRVLDLALDSSLKRACAKFGVVTHIRQPFPGSRADLELALGSFPGVRNLSTWISLAFDTYQELLILSIGSLNASLLESWKLACCCEMSVC